MNIRFTLIYNLLLPVFLFFQLPSALLKMRRRGGRWRDLAQRLALYDPATRRRLAMIASHENRLWMHAVSVGEANVAVKLLKRWLERDPAAAAVLTVTTPTAHAIASSFAAAYPDRLATLFSPLDLCSVMNRALEAFAPRQIVLVEAEIWPNLLSAALADGIPVRLVNARLSQRSERRFRRFSRLTRPLYERLDAVGIQDEADRARFEGLGVPANALHLTASIKYDPAGAGADPARVARLAELLPLAGIDPARHLILLAASTHAGEELELAKIHRDLRAAPGAGLENLALLLVPRHFERAAALRTGLAAAGFQTQMRSELNPNSAIRSGAGGAALPLIIDSTGELAAWQHLAHAVVVGKSFLAAGGQNPAEAALAGKPVFFGPHMENFEGLVSLLLEAGGAVQVADFPSLATQLRELLPHPGRLAEIGAAGRASLTRHQGATDRTIDLILNRAAAAAPQ